MRHCQSVLCFALVACTVAIGGCSRSSPGTADSTASSEESMLSDASESQETTTTENGDPSFYTVGHYDKASDPAADLTETLEIAKANGKRVILQVGGDWCVWCARISEYMDTNETVHGILDDNFVVMKVTYPGDNADAFLEQYPTCEGYPHLFVLENDGTFMHSQGTGELEEGKGYDQDVFVEFLESWMPHVGG
jgi:thioredoxin-related protein